MYAPVDLDGQVGVGVDVPPEVYELIRFLFVFFVPHLRPMGLNVLGYQSHLKQRRQGSSNLSPFLAYDFLSRLKFSTLTPRQPIIMVEFYLLTFSPFPRRKAELKECRLPLR